MLRLRLGFRYRESEFELFYFRVQILFLELLVKICVVGFLFYGNFKLEVGLLDFILVFFVVIVVIYLMLLQKF